MDTLRRRLSSWLHLLATRVYDDWHEFTVTSPDGTKVVTFCCYYQWTGSWPEDFEFECNC